MIGPAGTPARRGRGWDHLRGRPSPPPRAEELGLGLTPTARSRRPGPPAGAGALRPPHARREGQPARPPTPKAAFPPRGRAEPAAPAYSPFAPPLRLREQAAPRDHCQYPRWRPRPGPTGSPPEPAPRPGPSRRAGTQF